jgi:hypothetical protein
MSGDNVNGSTNIIPQMGMDALREGYMRVLNTIYAPKEYYARIRTFLKEYKLPEIQAPLETQYILGFVRSIYVLGIKGVERV